MRTSLIPVGVCVLGLLSACNKDERPDTYSDPIPNPEVPHERLPAQSSTFTETSCETKVAGHVTQCGIVEVPESPGSSETISLAVARVFSNEPNPAADPIVYLEGGPGGPSLINLDGAYPYLSQVAPNRDFIFVDQRGIGQTRPRLGCTEGGEVLDALGRCYDRLSEKADLNAYNTINNATDIDLVRQAFGYDEWNLYGISYGTRLGLTILRDYPEGVRSAVLDSVVPLQVDLLGEVGINGYRAFQLVFDACAEDESCAKRYPDAMQTFMDLLEDLNEEPGGEADDISGDMFARLVFELIYSPQGVELIPYIVAEATQGNFEFFEDLEEAVSRPGFAFGMHLSLHCSEEIPFSSAEAMEVLDSQIPEILRPPLSGAAYLAYCEAWPVTPAQASENEPAESDIRTLVVGGHFDPITPPRYAESAASFLSNSQYFYMEMESHGASLGECGLTMVKSFFEDPDQELSNCSAATPGLEFSSHGGASPAVFRSLRMRTEAPSPYEMEEIKDDLRRRRH